MKAVCWMGKKTSGRKMCLIRKSSIRATPSSGSPAPPSAARTCTSTTATCPRSNRRHSRSRVHGRSRRGRPVDKEAEGRRPSRRALHHRLRQMLLLQRATLVLCDNTNPNAWIAEKMMGYSPSGLFGYTHMWVATPADRRSTRAYLSPTSVRSRFRTAFLTTRCCSCLTSFPPATWAPRTATSTPGDTVAVWGCGPVGQFAIRVGLHARRGTRDRHRHGSRTSAKCAGEGGAEIIELGRSRERARSSARHDRRPRTRLLHGRRRHGSSRPRAALHAYDARSRWRSSRSTGACLSPMRSWPVVRAERFRCPVFTAASWTKFRSARS